MSETPRSGNGQGDDQATVTAVPAEAPDFKAAPMADMPAEEAFHTALRQAVEMKASDLFLLSDEHSLDLAVRWLGQMRRIGIVPKDKGRQLINYIKAVSGMDLAETRRPLDGRLVYELEGGTVDLRLNTIPTMFGQDLTCRVLDRSTSLLDLDLLGMFPSELGHLRAMLASPAGLILVSGPTGAGKTTTLYASLQHLTDGKRKINTLEDPIEYAMDGIRQSQVEAKLGVTFAELLRNVLRQSPDVIMIGEIRDPETAVTAVRAANSGHLVLATLHAPTAAGAVQSILALGVHPHFLASSLLGVIAQRLIRVLDPETRVSFDISGSLDSFEEVRDLLGPGEGSTIYGPGDGSSHFPDGYHSRTGLFEVMPVSTEMRRMIADSASARQILDEALSQGMLNFHRAALLKVARGITSTEEMMRTVPSEHLGLDD